MTVAHVQLLTLWCVKNCVRHNKMMYCLQCQAPYLNGQGHIVLHSCLTLKPTLFERVLNNFTHICPRTRSSHGLRGSVGSASDWRPGGRRFDPRQVRQHSFVEIDHEIFSTVILSLPLIQEGQLSVSGKRMCTILVNRLED